MANLSTFNHAAPYWVPVREKPVFCQDRKLKVICIGAGFGGLTLAHKWKHENMHEIYDLEIFEKNSEVGGTWFENHYPGVGCDVPAHIYTFHFEPNPNWTRFFVSGTEILDYIKKTATKYGLYEPIQLNSRVVSTVWNEVTAKWTVKIDQNGTLFDSEADILLNASGGLNKPNWPKVDGLHSFKGKLLHTARWDKNLDWKGKKVAIIGNGSSAMQALPEMQPEAIQIVTYMRSPTWITANFLSGLAPKGKNFTYSEETKKKFRENPEELFQYRKKVEHAMNGFFHAYLAGSPQQAGAVSAAKKIMEEGLGDHPELLAKLTPKFALGCRRISPGDKYLAAIGRPNVRVEFDPITRVTDRGIVTKGQEKAEDFDIIVCATGFNVDFIPTFDAVGKNGVRLADLWRDRPQAYFGITIPTMPNYFMLDGPNCPVAHGSLLTVMDFTAQWINKWIKKIVAEDIRTISTKQEPFEHYNNYSQEFIKRTVWAGNCNSWFKGHDGTVSVMYAGNVLHWKAIMESFRTEDFDITYNSPNIFAFMGNGFTKLDEDKEADLSFYLTRKGVEL